MASDAILTLLIGSSSPSSIPLGLAQAIQSVEVVHSDEERSGFQIVFQAGKDGASSQGYPILGNSLLTPFNRVIVQVNFLGTSAVLVDGIILHRQLHSGTTPNGSVFAVSGQDVSVMMDLEEKIVKYPALDEASVATQIIGQYSQYGLQPSVTTPPTVDTPDPNEYLPVQRTTDLRYLKDLASRFGFVFYVSPGSSPQTNVAYWGPPVVSATSQAAISVDSAIGTNTVGPVAFEYDALAATTVTGQVQDRITDQITAPDITSDDSERPALSANPAITSQSNVRQSLLELGEGRTQSEATAYTQGLVDWSSGRVATAYGTLDGLRYGAILETRALVDVRGASTDNDGQYYVKRVVHRLARHSYQQQFTLTREGYGSAESSVEV